MKAMITILPCPKCGESNLVAPDLEDTGLAVAKCLYCGEEFEIRQTEDGLVPSVRKKRVS
jgi:transcription elongation factor Elf1